MVQRWPVKRGEDEEGRGGQRQSKGVRTRDDGGDEGERSGGENEDWMLISSSYMYKNVE